jgi:hypothetical protein
MLEMKPMMKKALLVTPTIFFKRLLTILKLQGRASNGSMRAPNGLAKLVSIAMKSQNGN